jgi:hypothetical protein
MDIVDRDDFFRAASDPDFLEKANNTNRAYKTGEIIQLQQQCLYDELKKRNPESNYKTTPMTRYRTEYVKLYKKKLD